MHGLRAARNDDEALHARRRAGPTLHNDTRLQKVTRPDTGDIQVDQYRSHDNLLSQNAGTEGATDALHYHSET